MNIMDTELLAEHQQLRTTTTDAIAEAQEAAGEAVGINIEFLWVPTELAQEKRPGLDWKVKILVALAGIGARKAAGYKGQLATDQELADFLGLSSPRQVQKVIQRGMVAGLLMRQGMKERYLCGDTPAKCTTGIRIPRNVLDHPTMTWPQKALYSLVAGMNKGKQAQCYASNAWFGRYLGLSEIYIQKLVSKLVKEGCLVARYGKRSRYLNVTGNLPSPTAKAKQVKTIALEYHHDSPGVCPATPLDGPGVSPIRIINIKESKDISLAEPGKFFLGRTVTNHNAAISSDDTISTNRVEQFLNAQYREQIQDVTSSTSTTTLVNNASIPTRWNPLTDFEWQYKQFLTMLKSCYAAMQRTGLISRKRNLQINDAELRTFCQESLGGRLIEINKDYKQLDFTNAVADFQRMLFRSWNGIRLAHEPTDKFNVWLITKNTNDITKFIKRYPAICNQLKKKKEYDKDIDEVTRSTREQVLFNWLRHGWSARWNPTGNVLFADIPAEVIDYRELEQARMTFNYYVQRAISEQRANRTKPVPNLLHEGTVGGNYKWPRHFAWAMLHKAGLHEQAAQYAEDAIAEFRIRPEVLQVYRERMPEVMQKVRTWINNPPPRQMFRI